MYVKAAYRRHDPDFGEEDFDLLFCNASAAFWQALGPPITDNYIVRWGVCAGRRGVREESLRRGRGQHAQSHVGFGILWELQDVKNDTFRPHNRRIDPIAIIAV